MDSALRITAPKWGNTEALIPAGVMTFFPLSDISRLRYFCPTFAYHLHKTNSRLTFGDIHIAPEVAEFIEVAEFAPRQILIGGVDGLCPYSAVN
jgi:hypothetical protein